MLSNSINRITEVSNNNKTDTRPLFNVNIPRNSRTTINITTPGVIYIETRDNTVTENIAPLITNQQSDTNLPCPFPNTAPAIPTRQIDAAATPSLEVVACREATTKAVIDAERCKKNQNSQLQKQKNDFGKNAITESHTNNTPLYIDTEDIDRVYCAKCFNNGIRNPIKKMESLPSHLAICLPVSPFYKPKFRSRGKYRNI